MYSSRSVRMEIGQIRYHSLHTQIYIHINYLAPDGSEYILTFAIVFASFFEMLAQNTFVLTRRSNRHIQPAAVTLVRASTRHLVSVVHMLQCPVTLFLRTDSVVRIRTRESTPSRRWPAHLIVTCLLYAATSSAHRIFVTGQWLCAVALLCWL